MSTYLDCSGLEILLKTQWIRFLKALNAAHPIHTALQNQIRFANVYLINSRRLEDDRFKPPRGVLWEKVRIYRDPAKMNLIFDLLDATICNL